MLGKCCLIEAAVAGTLQVPKDLEFRFSELEICGPLRKCLGGAPSRDRRLTIVPDDVYRRLGRADRYAVGIIHAKGVASCCQR